MTLTSLVAVQSNIHPGPNLPGQVTEVLSLTEQEIGELMIKGELNVSDLMIGKEVFSIIIPERDVQRYDAKRNPS
jgi:hypothetical protein